MAEPRFGSNDDTPRVLRRAREEHERTMRERGGVPEPALAPAGEPDIRPAYEPAPPMAIASSGVVTRFEVPFAHLVGFFIKAALAAIPALILLAVLMFGFGKMLQAFFPELRLFEIVVRPVVAPPGPTHGAAATPAAEPAAKQVAPAKR